jgi:hypothetical protein
LGFGISPDGPRECPVPLPFQVTGLQEEGTWKFPSYFQEFLFGFKPVGELSDVYPVGRGVKNDIWFVFGEFNGDLIPQLFCEIIGAEANLNGEIFRIGFGFLVNIQKTAYFRVLLNGDLPPLSMKDKSAEKGKKTSDTESVHDGYLCGDYSVKGRIFGVSGDRQTPYLE